MQVGSIVYRASGDSGVVMESTVHRDGFVSVLWECSDSITETRIRELSLQPTSSPNSRNSGARVERTSSSLSLEEKLEILTCVGTPEQQDHVKELLSQIGGDDSTMGRQVMEGMVDQLLQGLEGRSSSSSPITVDKVRTKLSLLGDDDPRMKAMAEDQALENMGPEQLATLNGMIDMALSSQGLNGGSNIPEVEISKDFPETSILKYYGKRPEGNFAR